VIVIGLFLYSRDRTTYKWKTLLLLFDSNSIYYMEIGILALLLSFQEHWIYLEIKLKQDIKS